jgi:gamma-glutamyl hydrolase
MFHITSTNFDRDGRPFVSSIEGKKFPFYGVQYHPEKNNFEYGLRPGTLIPYEAIDHSSDAVYSSMFLASFFVNRVRHSSIGNYTLIERHPLIQDYPVRKGYKFEQIYLIPSANTWRNAHTNLRGSRSVWKDNNVSTN